MNTKSYIILVAIGGVIGAFLFGRYMFPKEIPKDEAKKRCDALGGEFYASYVRDYSRDRSTLNMLCLKPSTASEELFRISE